MNFRGVFPVFFAAGLFSFSSGATVTLTGRVVDNSATPVPIANATVSLKVNGAAAYSAANGQFTLNASTTGITQTGAVRNSIFQVSGDELSFSVTANEKVRIDIYDMAGQKVGALPDRAFGAGSHSLSLSAVMRKKAVPGLYIARITKGSEASEASETLTGAFLSMGAKGVVASDFTTSGQGKFALAKTAASLDSLIVYRMGYDPKALPLTTYTTQSLGDIVLTRSVAEVIIEHKIDSLLALMNINDKAGQMVQTQINSGSQSDRLTDAQYASMGVGSVFNGGSDASVSGTANSPTVWATMIDRIQNAMLNNSKLKIPMIYGQDCVHGAAEVAGCTVFPHDIGLGCTHDSALVAQVGRDVAAECAGIGIRLTFAPCISSVRNERWGRTFEGFGETPEINTQMGVAYVRGLQGDGDISQTGAISASVKHYLGDGATTNGVNNGNATVSSATMQAVHFPQYAACARQNAGVVMISYSTWTHDGNTWPQSLDNYAMTTLLKGQAGFDGVCLSDWDGLLQACNAYNNSCVASAINAGMDMVMIVANVNPNNFVNAVVADVANNTIPIARVNDAVRRILRLKLRMHLWDHPLSNATLRGPYTAHQDDARKAVRESMVLLKNTGSALPLLKTEKVVVVGPFADNMGAQCGGWTISWQGQLGAGPGIAGQTILAGLQAVGGASNVTYSSNGSAISGADKIVVVVGENPYAEGQGDVTVPDFSTCPNFSLVQTCVSSGKPVILVMLTGRPMILNSTATSCQAIVAAWLPGSEGAGVADVLYGGTYNFTGTLTHTWPATAAQIPINTGTTYGDEQHGTGGAPMFAYEFGLKY
jgi:Beta-glucosidase-related glycosidases